MYLANQGLTKKKKCQKMIASNTRNNCWTLGWIKFNCVLMKIRIVCHALAEYFKLEFCNFTMCWAHNYYVKRWSLQKSSRISSRFSVLKLVSLFPKLMNSRWQNNSRLCVLYLLCYIWQKCTYMVKICYCCSQFYMLLKWSEGWYGHEDHNDKLQQSHI